MPRTLQEFQQSREQNTAILLARLGGAKNRNEWSKVVAIGEIILDSLEFNDTQTKESVSKEIEYAKTMQKTAW